MAALRLRVIMNKKTISVRGRLEIRLYLTVWLNDCMAAATLLQTPQSKECNSYSIAVLNERETILNVLSQHCTTQ